VATATFKATQIRNNPRSMFFTINGVGYRESSFVCVGSCAAHFVFPVAQPGNYLVGVRSTNHTSVITRDFDSLGVTIKWPGSSWRWVAPTMALRKESLRISFSKKANEFLIERFWWQSSQRQHVWVFVRKPSSTASRVVVTLPDGRKIQLWQRNSYAHFTLAPGNHSVTVSVVVLEFKKWWGGCYQQACDAMQIDLQAALWRRSEHCSSHHTPSALMRPPPLVNPTDALALTAPKREAQVKYTPMI
jgi:hypothetical protein